MEKELGVLKNKIHDDNINKLIDKTQTANDDSVYIITEAQHGIQLFEWILTQNRAIFTENTVALIMREVFNALNVCQKHGIVHRDLRAENIIVKNKIT